MAAEFKIGRLRYNWVGSWAPGTVYARDSVIQYQGQAYVCLVPNTSNTNFYNDLYATPYPYWQLMTIGHSWAGNWTTNTLYSLNNLVIFGGTVYVCTTSHTSSVFASDTANWSVYVQDEFWSGAWQTNTAYGIGELVTYGGITYKCITDHTSASTTTLGLEANQSNWSVYFNGVSYLGPWSTGYRYKANDLVKVDADIYICIVGHTSESPRFTGSANWTMWIPGQKFDLVWNSGTSYNIGDTVIYGGNAYVSKTANNSNNIPDISVSNWGLFNVGYSVQGSWNSNTTYAPGAVVNRHGLLYEAVSTNAGQDPTAYSLTETYNATGSSGTTLVINTSFTANTTSNSATLTSVSNAAALSVGNSVTGLGIANGSIIFSINVSTNTVILSLPATSTLTGTTVTYTNTNNIVPGMLLIGSGFTSGQQVSSITNSSTIVLDRAPDATLTNNQLINFVGVNQLYWKLLSSGTNWTNKWTLGTTYVTGDIVIWSNGTYKCSQPHIANGLNRPDADATNTYWTLFIAGDRNNSLNTYGDLETFNNGAYQPVPINNGINTAGYSTQSYLLRVNGNIPNWQQINVVPSVYYVDTSSGQDISTYGTSWDSPFKTIKYACNFIGKGLYYPNATSLLAANKAWMITEMYQWMLYQCANNIAPFSTSSLFDPFYTQRDAGYIIDAVIYDMQRGGNSQTVAATLRWFYYGSQTQFANQLIESAIAYFAPSLTYLQTLMLDVVNNAAPASNYQSLNGISSNLIITQQTNTSALPESGSALEITSLMNIPITAVTNQNTYLIPSSNSGLTAIINIKTGTYNESLPIVVPENVSIVGDELRSVTVQPATSIEIYATSTNALTNIVTVTNTVGLIDQMPLQFISPYVNNASTSFDANINPGQTYYVLGSSITSTGFQILNAPNINFIGTTVSGSNVLYNVSKITGLTAGMTISGLGIPDNTTVISTSQAISGIATVTMSQAATLSNIYQPFTASGSIVSLAGGVGSMLIYAGDCLKDMWYMTNGTTMRNLSNFGLMGMLSQTDSYAIARPTGGKYTSLNPGNGPDDTSVWIIRRSPYIQNVTNFGTGCSGAVVDGALHNGGTKAMLHNDYTQVLSDGIGVWIRNSGAISECVSVFSYYCYIGHFAEAGGRIRSTNGNSSYGTFGVVSEGFDVNEVPATGTIFNQSTQVQASVVSAFGTANQLLKLNYSNAGSAYYLPATNMLQYSNLFTTSVWSNDGNVTFIKNETAPTGYTEGWLLTGSKSTAGTGYIQQSVNINPAGYFYSAVSGTTQNGAAGNGATFDVTITNTAYVVAVHSGSAGTLYQVGNTILIKGSTLGGIDGTNDLTITVGTLTGTGISTISSVVGTVPSGSSQNYTLSIYVYPGTSQTVDLQGVFSGSSTVVSGISYNVISNTVTPYAGTALGNSTNAGIRPVYYGAQKTLVPGWYRIWLTVNDTIGLNNTLTFKFFPQGANAPVANTYSIFYASQLELSGSTPAPDFYLETTTGMFTAYANYEVVGAGSGVSLAGEETRSGSVFNARITTDGNGYTGGSGYATSSNNAQSGSINTIQLAQSDVGIYNYVGMRVFINSGTGAGQYGFISYYNGAGGTVNGVATKTALVCQEAFDTVSVVASTYSSTATNNLLTLASGSDLSKMYVNQPIQFIPTFYTSTITSTSIGSVTATATSGGTTNTISVPTASLQLNMPVVFSGTGFNLTPGYTYYIVNIDYNNNLIQVSNVIYGNPVQLSTVVSGSMTMSYPNYSGYLNSFSTSNMTPNFPIQFTGFALGGVTLGNTYYISDIIDSSNFTISTQLVSLTSTSTTGGSTNTIQATTTSLIPLNPVVFSGTMFDASITAGVTYYISNIIDSSDFQIATSIIRTTATATQFSTNLITMTSVTGFVLNQPIIFSGIAANTTFGNIQPETVYYIQTINPSTKQITISASVSGGIAGAAFALTNNSGLIMARTCPAATVLGGGTGSMSVTSTGSKLVVTNSIGATNSMNATFSTSVFGGVNSYTIYYITAINPGSSPTISISTTLAGTPLTLTTGLGTMQLCASGWDNINPGTPAAASLDTTSVYYIEPRTVISSPPNSQVAGVVTTQLAIGNSWQGIAYGNNYFLAIPNAGATGATSSDGLNWTSMVLPSTISTWTSIAFGNFYWIALGTTGTGTSVAAYSNSNGLGWRSTNMPSNTTWNQIVYGNGIFVAIATSTSSAAYTKNFGATWTASATGLLATKTWVGLSYGTGIFLAVASDGTGAWSYDGNTWQATTLPQSTATLSGITITGSAGTFTFTKTTSQLLVGQTVVISGSNGGTGTVANGTYYIIATNGSTSFTLGASAGAGSGISTSAGNPSGLTFLVGAPAYTSVTFGNNRFVATQSGTGLRAAYSFNGITWYQSLTYLSANLIAYGQGAFVAVQSNGTTEYKSDSGLYWYVRTLTYGNIGCIGFGFNASNVGVFPTLSSTGATSGNANAIYEGVKPQGRAVITSTVMTAVNLFETGSNYSVAPTIAFIDYNVSVNSLVIARIGNGTLSNPTFVSRGSGYNTTSTVVTITGNGFADTYQTGYTLIINNLSSLPLVGSNLSIAGNSQVYKVTSATAVYGTSAPFIEANVQISPTMTNALSPANGAAVSLRQLYSQVRLTNHDFLSIGSGNRQTTNYPYVDETTAKPQNEAIEVNQGHVFYTSTDENGNFLVGGLFGVEQATGTVTLSATQFGLQGLSQLSLGGIAVGGQSTIITQFSTDPTFVSNSDAVVPTQRAIKSYLAGRLSQGGANTYTGQLIAGTVEIGGAVYIKSTVPNGAVGSVVKMANKVNIAVVPGSLYPASNLNVGVDGNLAALEFFMRNANHRS